MATANNGTSISLPDPTSLLTDLDVNDKDIVNGGNVVFDPQSDGSVLLPNQMLFVASGAGTATANGTGDGTAFTQVFTGLEVIDRGSNFVDTTGIFTAPVTGLYMLTVNMLLLGITVSHTDAIIKLVTTDRNFHVVTLNPGAMFADAVSDSIDVSGSYLVHMTAGDTASILVNVLGGTKVVDTFDIYFAGALLG